MEVDVIAEKDLLSQDNQPTPEVLSKYRLAGHFCSVAIQSVLARCVADVNCTELCQIGDERILSQVPFSTAYSDLHRLRKCINQAKGALLNLHRSM